MQRAHWHAGNGTQLAARTRGLGALLLAVLMLAPASVTFGQGRPDPEVLNAVVLLPTEITVSGEVVANSSPDACRVSSEKVGATHGPRTVRPEVRGGALTLRGGAPFFNGGSDAAGPIDADGRFEAVGAGGRQGSSRWVGHFGPHGSGFARVAEVGRFDPGCTVEWHVTFLPTARGLQDKAEIEAWRPVDWPEPPASCPDDPGGVRVLAMALEEGGHSRGLYAMEEDARCLRRVADFPNVAPFFAGLSPDGQQALIGGFAQGTATEWHLVNLSDGTTTPLPGDAYAWPVWAANGQPTRLSLGYRGMGIHPWGNRASVAAPDWSLVAVAWDVYGASSHSSGILVVDTSNSQVVATVGPPPEVCAATPPPQDEVCAPGRALEPLGFSPDGALLYYRVGPTRVANAWTAVEAVRLDGSGEVVLSQRLADARGDADLEWHLRALLLQSEPPRLSADGLALLASVPRGAGYDLLAIDAQGLRISGRVARAPARLNPIAHRLPGPQPPLVTP